MMGIPAAMTLKVPAVATASRSLQPGAPLTKAHLLRGRGSGRRRGMKSSSSSQQQAPGTLTPILVSMRLASPAAQHHHTTGRTSRCSTYRYQPTSVYPFHVYLRCLREKGDAAHSTAKWDVNWVSCILQMEFCPRTLKKILVAGPIEEADAWQVMMNCIHHMFSLIRVPNCSGHELCSGRALAHCNTKCLHRCLPACHQPLSCQHLASTSVCPPPPTLHLPPLHLNAQSHCSLWCFAH